MLWIRHRRPFTLLKVSERFSTQKKVSECSPNCQFILLFSQIMLFKIIIPPKLKSHTPMNTIENTFELFFSAWDWISFVFITLFVFDWLYLFSNFDMQRYCFFLIYASQTKHFAHFSNIFHKAIYQVKFTSIS